MTNFSKTVFALLLLAGGFVAAKAFGPPDLAQRLVDSWRPAPASQWGELQPAEPDDHHAEYLAPLDAVEMPASFSSAYTRPDAQPPGPAPVAQRPVAQQSAPLSDWPAMPQASAPAPAADAWNAPASTVQPSVFESEMVPLRAAPNADPPRYETAKPNTSGWGGAPADPYTAPATDKAADNQTPTSFAPWGAPLDDPAGPAQFAGYPGGGDAWPAGMNAPVSPPAMWQAQHEEKLVPLPPQAADLDLNEESLAGRTHIVVDGDSLSRLAARYLGDADRSTEIFQRNRDVLTHPDLLPLGVELQLP